jgi:cytosine permease
MPHPAAPPTARPDAAVADPADRAVFSEYESEPVPPHARRRTSSVAAVWLGFPMILTCAVFGGLVVHSLGFWPGMGAIAVGTLVLMLYVGALSYLAGRSGESFALMAMRTFGAKGYVVPAAFLATVVIGWFAFQTGLTGSTLHGSLGWDQTSRGSCSSRSRCSGSAPSPGSAWSPLPSTSCSGRSPSRSSPRDPAARTCRRRPPRAPAR